MKFNKTIITTILIIVFSFVLGIISNDPIIGSIVLSTGILSIWFQVKGKAYNYIFACIYDICNAYISYKNNLYGLFLFSLLLHLPLNIYGFINWNKNKDDNNNVSFRKFNKTKSILVILSAIISSIILGYILRINPNQRLEFLDSTADILNIYGIVLLSKRLREGWYVSLFDNIVDLSIWILNFLDSRPNSLMMIYVSLIYLIIGIYGIYKYKSAKEITSLY